MSSTDSVLDAPACDVRFGQVGLANIRVLAEDSERLRDELARRVSSAPRLFAGTAVVLDLSHLSHLPDDDTARQLLAAVRAAGMRPVGLAYGDEATARLAERLDLPLIARFRDAYESQRTQSAPASAPVAAPGTAAPSLLHDQHVRSGQQVYAAQGDLVVTASVANGAEVLADGSIHVYGTLRGRALAGAQGNEDARIFCQDFRAQLVSIAGQYRVFEELPDEYAGHAVQCWLEDGKLRIAKL